MKANLTDAGFEQQMGLANLQMHNNSIDNS